MGQRAEIRDLMQISLCRIGLKAHDRVILGAVVTYSRHTETAYCARRKQRSSSMGRMLLTRALPGSVAVVATLLLPELSAGAGGFGAGSRIDKPREPMNFARHLSAAPAAGRVSVSVSLANIDFRPQSQIRPLGVRAVPLPDVSGSEPNPVYAENAGFVPVSPVDPPIEPAQIEQSAALLRSDPPNMMADPMSPALETTALGSATPSILASELSAGFSADATSAAAEPADHGAAAGVNTVALAPVQSLAPNETETTSVSASPLAQQAFVAEPQLPPGLGSGSPTVGADVVGRAASAFSPATAVADDRSAIPQSLAVQSAPPETALTALPAVATQLEPAPGLGTSATSELEIHSQLVTRVDGKAAGQLDFLQTTTGLSVRLGSIVEVLGDRYEPETLARIKASEASGMYFSLAELKAQGIPISYDPVYDEFNIGQTDTRPKAARKVHMDQISAPERGLISSGIDQVRR